MEKLSPPNTRQTNPSLYKARHNCIPRLCDPASWSPLSSVASSHNLGAVFLPNHAHALTSTPSPTNHGSLVPTTSGAASAASYFHQQQQQGYAYSALPTAATGIQGLPAAAAAYAAAAGPTTVNQAATVRNKICQAEQPLAHGNQTLSGLCG